MPFLNTVFCQVYPQSSMCFMKKNFTEKQLLLLMAEGDKESFSVIYRNYWHELYCEAYKRLGNKEQSEDIVEEIFISLWERRINLQIENLSAYLYTAVRYRVYNYVARNRITDKFYEPFETLVSPSGADAIMIGKELEQLARIYIDALPKKRKKIFALYFDENLSTREIAEQLNISQKTVQNQLGTAMNGLRACILPMVLCLICLFSALG